MSITEKLKKITAGFTQAGSKAAFTGTLLDAANKGDLDAVKALVAQDGIDLNEKDPKGMTALSTAARWGFKDIVDLLLAAPGVDINAQDKWGYTALIWAAHYNFTDVVTSLVNKGADLDLADKRNGNTAQGVAELNNHPEAAQILKEASAAQKKTVKTPAGPKV